MYDVIVAGAGVTGAFIARELSKYDLKCCILEKDHDVASGASKANSGIVHSGYDCTAGSLKAKLNIRGAQLMETIAVELDVPYKKIGSLVTGQGEKDYGVLRELLERGICNGVKNLSIIEGSSLKKMEPLLADEVTHALYAPDAGIICPYELTVAAVENAVENGVDLYRDCKVTGCTFYDSHMEVDTSKGSFSCRYFVNSTGVSAGLIALLAGDDSLIIKPRKGEYLLLDKSAGRMVNKVIFQCPTSAGKGVLVTPTVDGNIMIGPNAQTTEDPEDHSTSSEGLEYVLKSAGRVIPGLDMKQVITSFAGLRSSLTTRDFIIEPAKEHANFIQVAGIDSPGLTCAPAIGEFVIGILEKQGLKLQLKKNHKIYRDKVVRFRELQGEELDQLLLKDPSYGRIVCRCEKVTEGEVRDSIRRHAGALDLDGVKRRTRAGMGRCQGGFCSPRIVELLAKELEVPCEEVTKKGGSSWILAGRTK